MGSREVQEAGFKPGDRVLVVWSQTSEPEALQQMVTEVQAAVAAQEKVSVENAHRLLLSSHKASSFDWVLSYTLWEPSFSHNAEELSEMARLLKPGGQLRLQEPLTSSDRVIGQTLDKLMAALKLSGFISVTEESVNKRACLSAAKPNFEVGSSSQIKLSFGKTRPDSKRAALDSNTANLWTLSAKDMADDDVDLLDSDTLLDEEDLKKPEPASLKVSSCGDGASKKKKACKNCTCGLAEELDQDSEAKQSQPKSACGSCYLGDAFRCASCPYLGMPAFKPGEKIVLDNNTLMDV
ncbi:unnamed protein product [Knipowitschia caucasica]|uniref:Anamorsin n=1 Tax=Knipowitschia caucasica TaxID=637954 RepID=A0AAV2KQS2_KNICA